MTISYSNLTRTVRFLKLLADEVRLPPLSAAWRRLVSMSKTGSALDSNLQIWTVELKRDDPLVLSKFVERLGRRVDRTMDTNSVSDCYERVDRRRFVTMYKWGT